MNKNDFKIIFSHSKNRFYITPKKSFTDVRVDIIGFSNNVIYTKTFKPFNENISYWLYVDPTSEIGLTLKISNTETSFTETVRLRSDFGKKIKPIGINVDKLLGVGDFMWVTPLIRKLYNTYQQKLTILGYPQYEEFIINNPYINSFVDKTKLSNNELIDYKTNYQFFDVFTEVGSPYWLSDLSQLAAKSAGLTLKDDELELDYIPNDYEIIEELPDNFVCINPRIISIDRTWEKEKWQKLINDLNEKNIPVVAIGVDDSIKDLDIKNGANLVNDERQSNLSQTWHILNKSKVFVTFDTGIYILAGTTNTHIIQLGWNHDPYFHKPFNKKKYSHISGECTIYCGSDPKLYVNINGNIHNLPTIKCILDTNFSCKPHAEQVVEEIVKIF